MIPNAGIGALAQILSKTNFDGRMNTLNTPLANQKTKNSGVKRTMMGI